MANPHLERIRGLPPELRTAGIAAVALVVSMVLPWYQKSYIPPGARVFAQDDISAFGVFSFVEAAVMLVAFGVLFLVWARADRRAFHLPGGDGTVIMAAGGWALLLLIWRLFDKPDAHEPSGTIGIQWGIFGAMLAAGALTAAGARVRAAHRPEPPNPAADDAKPVRARRPHDPDTVTQVLRDRPSWEGEPPAPPGAIASPSPPPPAGGSRRRNGRSEPPATERLF